MQKEMLKRLEQLKAEYNKGQQVLASLQQQQAETQETLVRISGAIQVLEEMLEEFTAKNDQGGEKG